MEIGIVVPGEDQLSTAGVRIRYNRLKSSIEATGHRLVLLPLDSFKRDRPFDQDAYIFCKCHDARSLLLADLMKQSGVQVGVDVFDDYYSQTENSRFVHLRYWFASIIPSLTFMICSTRNMRDMLAQLVPALPCHVVNDPFERLDEKSIADSVTINIERAQRTRRLEIGWFGIGDNPHFPLGLQDVQAYGEALGACRRAGFTPQLTILTNRRALGVDGLETLSRLQVPFRLEEWTESLERDLIRRSTFCFISVNAQSFSVVKSLNRAVTALTGGTQVLSAGFPLYAGIEGFIYRDIAALIADIETGCPLLREDTLTELKTCLENLANPEVEARKLVDFVHALPVAEMNLDLNPFVAVVHGRRTLGAVHRQFQQFGYLSVASPFTTANMTFDLRYEIDPKLQEIGIILSERAAMLINEELVPFLKPVKIGKGNFKKLPADAMPFKLEAAIFGRKNWMIADTMASYAAAMDAVSKLLIALLGNVKAFLCELDSPYSSNAFRALEGPLQPSGQDAVQ